MASMALVHRYNLSAMRDAQKVLDKRIFDDELTIDQLRALINEQWGNIQDLKKVNKNLDAEVTREQVVNARLRAAEEGLKSAQNILINADDRIARSMMGLYGEPIYPGPSFRCKEGKTCELSVIDPNMEFLVGGKWQPWPDCGSVKLNLKNDLEFHPGPCIIFAPKKEEK